MSASFVFFGDSLSDDGNLFDLTDGIVQEDLRTSLAGPTQSVSDGIVFPEYMDALIGDGAALNYAIAGALGAGSLSLGDLILSALEPEDLLVPLDDPALELDVNLGAQVDRFSADVAGQDVSEMTAFILVGSNDYSGIDASDPLGAIVEFIGRAISVVGEIAASAEQLAQDGVGRIVVSTLPNATFFPRIAGDDEQSQLISSIALSLHNALLTNAVEELAANGVPVEIIDMAPITTAFTNDPESFGIIAPLDDTLTEDDGVVLDTFDADQVGFFDDVHPSTATHGVIGAYFSHALDNPVHEFAETNNFAVFDDADDLALSNGGDDVLLLGEGDDLAFAGQGDDTVIGGAGSDLISGGSGADDLRGGANADILDGDSGNDMLRGGGGDDLLIDGLGDDTVLGGLGNDSFVFTESSLIGGSGADEDVFDGGFGQDTLYLVLEEGTAAAFGADVSVAELDSLGITAINIEDIVVIVGRDDIPQLSEVEGFDQADLWGLL